MKQEKLNFKIIKSNILKFIDDYGYDKRTGIRDIYIDETKSKIYVSLTNELKRNCFHTSIIQSNLNYEYLEFTELLVPNDCISLINDYGEFNFLQHGGRITGLDSLNILLSTGEYRYRTKSQLDDNLFGKIIKYKSLLILLNLLMIININIDSEHQISTSDLGNSFNRLLVLCKFVSP